MHDGRKKLALNRETVRALQDDDLRAVVGGAGGPVPFGGGAAHPAGDVPQLLRERGADQAVPREIDPVPCGSWCTNSPSLGGEQGLPFPW